MSVKILKQNGYNFLWIDGYLWMWDIPIERQIQKKIADQAYGIVLVAGYGLGIVQQYLMQNKDVNLILTVEQHKKVVDLCYKEYERIYGTLPIYGDFYKFKNHLKFDCIIGDIWDDITPEQLPKYIKFKNHAQTLLTPGGKILAWGKDYFEYLLEKEK